MAKYSKPTGKSPMMKQRDRGGYNSHGHKHPAQMGREMAEVTAPPKLPKVGLTPVKARTCP